MEKRNFSMQQYWEDRASRFEPLYTFKGNDKDDWKTWFEKSYPKYIELLGDFPQKTDLKAETEYRVEDGDLIRERVVFNSEENMSVPCQVLRPSDMNPNKSNAAILCVHGHGTYANESVAGIRGDAGRETEIELLNYNYAEKLAKAGFLTIAPCLRCFGERSDGKDPFLGRDPCNINFIKGVIMGIYTLTLNIWDMKCCVDYLESRPEVDPKRIGMMGLSYGGTMTAFTTAAVSRIKAADIIGYVNPWSEFAIKDAQFCGSQIVPDIFRYFDTHDIAGLIAPRPLLVEMGIYDQCFPIKNLLKGYEGIKKIYKAAGSEDKLLDDIFPKGHSFGENKVFDFFNKYL